jgi:hypothetical protein
MLEASGSGFRVQGSAPPLAAKVYPPQEGGQFDRKEKLWVMKF